MAHDRSSTISPWKRNLYEKHPYKDTYFDRSVFLDSLVIVSQYENRPLSWDWQACCYSIEVVSVPFLIVVIHWMLKVGNISPEILFLFELVFSVCCWAIFLSVKFKICGVLDWEILKVWGLFLVCFRIAAPAFQTLTVSFSDDTILAVTTLLFGIHMISKSVGSAAKHLSGTVSLSAAMLAVLILASRQSNPNSIVVFLLLSVMLLVYLPLLLELESPHNDRVLLHYRFFLWVVTSCAMYYVEHKLAAVYTFIIIICCFVGPKCYSIMMQNKQSWSGPWDTAQVHIK